MRVMAKHKGFRLIDLNGACFQVERAKNWKGNFMNEWSAKLISIDDGDDYKRFDIISYNLSKHWEGNDKKFKTMADAVFACEMSV